MFGLNSQVAPNVCVNKCRENRSSYDIYHCQALLNVVIFRLSRELIEGRCLQIGVVVAVDDCGVGFGVLCR